MKPGRSVVFITYSGLPDGDPDDLLALTALAAMGYETSVVDWRQTAPEALSGATVVLRSTWDYHRDCQDFLAWIKAVSTVANLQNRPGLVLWNANKKYLLALQEHGVAIVPTLHIKGADALLFSTAQLTAALCQWPEAQKLIIKPAIGLSTFGVVKFDLALANTTEVHAEAVEHIRQLATGSDVIVQPYFAGVEKYGERSLIFIDGVFSHSVRKSAFQKLAAAGEAGETSVIASADEIAFGEKTLRALAEIQASMGQAVAPLYARVDVVPDNIDGGDEGGKPLLLELELIEPSLFLSMADGAPQRFAAAVARSADAFTESNG